VEAIHNFLDRRLIIPPVNIQNINVRSAKLSQAGLHRVAHGFQTISCETDFLFDTIIVILERRRVLCEKEIIAIWEDVHPSIDTYLCRYNNLITDASFLEPFSNDHFTIFFLTTRPDKYAVDIVTRTVEH
jgi:hypothetical protein